MKGALGTAYDAYTNTRQKIHNAVGDAASSAWESTKQGAKWLGQRWVDNAVPDTMKRAWNAGSSAASNVAASVSGASRPGAATGSNIGQVLETGAGYNVVRQADGSVVKQSGARNWRNNNPGNIEYGPFAQRNGAIGSDGRFAIFPSYEVGRAAKSALIFDDKKYRDKSLTAAIAQYAPPVENNTAGYQASVLAAAGGQNKRMSDYTATERTAIMNAMEKVEGYKAGKVTTISPATATTSTPATAASTVPRVPAANVPTPTASQVPAAPAMEVPPGRLSGAAEKPTQVVVADPSNQDVRDRRIAQTVSGGISVK